MTDAAPPPPPNDTRGQFDCHDCGAGFDEKPDRCPKCGCCHFDRNLAYTPPAVQVAALKARAAQATALDRAARAEAVARARAQEAKQSKKRAESAQADPRLTPVEAARAAGKPGSSAYHRAYSKAARALPGAQAAMRAYQAARKAKLGKEKA